MTEVKYHINPQTGNVNKCTAVYRCKFNLSESRHYDSKQEAMSASEDSLTAEMMDVDKTMRILTKDVQKYDDDNVSYDPINNYTRNINEWNYTPWSQDERENLHQVIKILNIVSQDGPLSENDDKKIQNSIERLHRVKNPGRYTRSTFAAGVPNEYYRRDRSIINLAYALYERKKVDSIPTPEPAPQRELNTNIIGLEEARKEHFSTFNDPGYDFLEGRKTVGENAEEYVEDSINRYAHGEEYNDIYEHYVPTHERVMKELDSNNQLYLTLVFPDKELKKSMDKAGVSQVTVTAFNNSREWGNAYTVLTPDGSTRTFSVYEHRNSDSIIINGKKNWKGIDEELPYAGDSKNSFFDEFHPDDKQKAADVLTYYMKAAQKGDLDDDGKLVRNGSRRDWVNILSEQFPGFEQWHREKSPEYYEDEHLSNDERTLKRLDFDID